MRSWMIIERDGQRRPVEINSNSRQGVLAAVRRARKAGRKVVSAYQGGPWAIALSPQVYPRPA